MNKLIDLSELSNLLSYREGRKPEITGKFIDQLFKSIEKELIANSSVKIEELGTFKIIKSGSQNRILFLGAVPKSQMQKRPEPIKEAAQTSATFVSDQEKSTVPSEDRDKTTLSSDAQLTINEPTTAEESAHRKKVSLQDEPTVGEPTASSPQSDAKVSENKDNNLADNKSTTTDKNRDRRSQAKNDPYSYIPEKEYFEDDDKLNNNAKANMQSDFKRIWMPVIIIFCIVVIGFIFYEKVTPAAQDTKLSLDHFSELNNNDKENYSCIIITDSDISLKYLAKAYYGNEAFWPYIYKANTNIVDPNFIIKAKSIVKIPKLTVDLVSFQKGELDAKAKLLEDEIMATIDK